MVIRVLGATLALAVVLTGCSSKEKAPTVLPPVPSASPSLAPLSPPPEAAAETSEGASAFARYYFETVVNRGYETLDPIEITTYSDPACNSCKNIVNDIERLKASELRVGGQRFVIEFAVTSQIEPGKPAIVDFRFNADTYREVDASGKVVREFPAQRKQDAQAAMIRSGDGWLVYGLRMLEQ